MIKNIFPFFIVVLFCVNLGIANAFPVSGIYKLKQETMNPTNSDCPYPNNSGIDLKSHELRYDADTQKLQLVDQSKNVGIFTITVKPGKVGEYKQIFNKPELKGKISTLVRSSITDNSFELVLDSKLSFSTITQTCKNVAEFELEV